MRRARVLLAGVALLAPALARAAEGGVLDLQGGIAKDLLGVVMEQAYGLFALLLVVALAMEAFASSPTRPKDYGGVVYRALVVVALLRFYPFIFGTVASTIAGIASHLAPATDWEQANSQIYNWFVSANLVDGKTPEASLSGVSGMSAYFFDALIMLVASLGQAVQWCFSQLTRILEVLFYVLGPLAVVSYLPAPRGMLGTWFKSFVTISTWPLFSALLLRISTSFVANVPWGASKGTQIAMLCVSLLTVAMTLCVPKLAQAFVGGAVGNMVGQGMAMASGAIAGAVSGGLTAAGVAGAGLKMGGKLGGSAAGAVGNAAGNALQGAQLLKNRMGARTDLSDHVPPPFTHEEASASGQGGGSGGAAGGGGASAPVGNVPGGAQSKGPTPGEILRETREGTDDAPELRNKHALRQQRLKDFIAKNGGRRPPPKT